MNLRTDNRIFEVVQSGDDFLHLKNPETFPAGMAEFEIIIDGESHRSVMAVAALHNSIRVEAIPDEASVSMVAEP